MAILTQGTQIYFVDPDGGGTGIPAVTEVSCPTNFSPGGNPSDQIETTCLKATARSYMPGLRTPGQASMTINADPSEDSHIRLHELCEQDPQPTLRWAVGWSDGDAAPTLDSDGSMILPATRTWYLFEGYVSDFPFEFGLNAVVQTQIAIQRSGGSEWKEKQ